MDPSSNPAQGSPTGAAFEGEFMTAGEKFGDYQVMHCLYFGMFGGLYRMQNIRNFTEVCIHVFPKACRENAEFLREYKTMAARLEELRHPSILQVQGHEIIKDRPCLIHEVVEGVNMGAYLEKYVTEKKKEAGTTENARKAEPKLIVEEGEEDRPEGEDASAGIEEKDFGLPAVVTAEVMEKVMSALEAAHQDGIYHLHLNPANIILLADGEVKVAGFGFMQICGNELFEQLVSAGIVPIQSGNERFSIDIRDALSPEVRRREDPDHRADYFAFAHCCYYFLTGRKPKIGNLRAASTFSPAISAGWDSFLETALDPDPDKRFGNGTQLAKGYGKTETGSTKPPPGGKGAAAAQLERVPLPASLKQSLPAKWLRAIRLGILGLIGVLVVFIAWMSVTIIFEEENTQHFSVRETPQGRLPQLRLTVDPPRADVLFMGKARGKFKMTDGSMDFSMPHGRYTLVVSAPGFVPEKLSRFDILDGQRNVELTLDPAWGALHLRALPGARVFAKELPKPAPNPAKPGPEPEEAEPVFVGEIPEDGLLKVDELLMEGGYRITVERAGYQPAEFDVELELDEVVRRDVVLEPLPARFRVVSDPAGAYVVFDGKTVGKTPIMLTNLKTGVNEITVVHPDYRTKSIRIPVEPGDNSEIDFGRLERKVGTLNVRVTVGGEPPAPELREALELYFGGEKLPEGSQFDGIPAGERELVVTHPDYIPDRRQVKIYDRELVEVDVDLKPRPGQVVLEFAEEVPYIVAANGQRLKMGDDNTVRLSPGREVQLEIAIRNHKSFGKRVKLGPNERITLQVPLIPIPGPEPGKPYEAPLIGLDLTWIKPGSYTIGSQPREQERRPEEGPPSEVRISPGFWMGTYEITQGQYADVMGSNPSRNKTAQVNELPVENVAWGEAVAFTERLTEMERKSGRLPEGYVYRLPTEAEWEYAARAGTTTPFSFGEQATPENANLSGVYPRSLESRGIPPAVGAPRRVGSYPANPWGLHDMHGNVREWTLTPFNSRYRVDDPDNYTGPPEGDGRVVRGGGWEDFAHRGRSASRFRMREGIKSPSTGFRVVLAPKL